MRERVGVDWGEGIDNVDGIPGAYNYPKRRKH